MNVGAPWHGPRPMPILRGAVTFARFLVEHPDKPPADVRRWFTKGLRARAFEPLDPKDEEDRTAGFAELEDPDATDFASGNLFMGQRALFTWRIDQRKVPAAQLRGELDRWAREFERGQGRAPARKEKTERKNALRQKLRADAVPVTRTHDVAWDLKTQRLQVWSASRKVVEEIAMALEEGFEVRLKAQLPEEKDSLKPTAELVGPSILEGSDGQA
jgi:recombination associated protein RdgC